MFDYIIDQQKKSWPTWVKLLIAIVVLGVLAFIFVPKLSAQTTAELNAKLDSATAVTMVLQARLARTEALLEAKQGASFADATMPSNVIFVTATDCLRAAAEVLPPHDAANYCRRLREAEAKRSVNVAKAARGCTSWWCMPPAGAGYGGSTYGTSYGGGGGSFATENRNVSVWGRR